MNIVFFAVIAATFAILGYIAYKYEISLLPPNATAKIPDSELVKVLLSLDDESLNELFASYKTEFGRGAAYYARRTYRRWQTGKVRPNRQTFQRFFVQLPKVMSYDLKCEVLRKLMQEFCAKDNYDLQVSTGDWEEKLTPLVETMIQKAYTTSLPKSVEEKLQWLALDEMRIAQNILKNSQIEEGKIAVSMLRGEIADIEVMLENAKGKSRITHRLKFPYGTINLEIKRR